MVKSMQSWENQKKKIKTINISVNFYPDANTNDMKHYTIPTKK